VVILQDGNLDFLLRVNEPYIGCIDRELNHLAFIKEFEIPGAFNDGSNLHLVLVDYKPPGELQLIIGIIYLNQVIAAYPQADIIVGDG